MTSADAERELRWHRTDCFRDPIEVLQKVDAPVLAVYGTDDSIIDIGRNMPLMRSAIEARDDGRSSILVFDGAGHGMLGRMLPPMLADGYADQMGAWIWSTLKARTVESERPDGEP